MDGYQLLCIVIDTLDFSLCQNGVNGFKPMEHLLVERLSAITGRAGNEFGTQIVEEGSIGGIRFPSRDGGHQGT